MNNKIILEKLNKLTPSQKQNIENLIDLFILKNQQICNKSTL